MARPTARTGQAKRRRFLEAFAELGTITHAAREAGISRNTHYDWLASDPAYAAEFAEAERQAIDALEREIRRRALEGVEEPVYYQGERVDTIRKYSDTLLIFAAKGALPDKYRERISVVTEDALDAEIRRLSVELDRRGIAATDASESAGSATPPPAARPG